MSDWRYRTIASIEIRCYDFQIYVINIASKPDILLTSLRGLRNSQSLAFFKCCFRFLLDYTLGCYNLEEYEIVKNRLFRV